MPGYLYRRTSGVYVVRICVPFRLRQRIGRREIHVSTKSREASEAKALAFAILAAWQQWVVELKKMDLIKITEGSALLSGKSITPDQKRNEQLNQELAKDSDWIRVFKQMSRYTIIHTKDSFSGTLKEPVIYYCDIATGLEVVPHRGY